MKTQDKVKQYYKEYKAKVDSGDLINDIDLFKNHDDWITTNINASVWELGERADYVTTKIMTEGDDKDIAFMVNEILSVNPINLSCSCTKLTTFLNIARILRGCPENFEPFRDVMKKRLGYSSFNRTPLIIVILGMMLMLIFQIK